MTFNKKIRGICLLFTFFFLSLSLFSQSDGKFNLSGSIKLDNGEEEVITITYTDIVGENVSISQTTKGGFFFVTGEIPHPFWARFYGEKSKANGSFFIEPGNVVISLSPIFPFLREVKGSKTHDEYKHYKSNFRPDLKVKTDSLYSLIKKVNETKQLSEDEVKRRSELYAIISNLNEQKSLDYIKTFPSSFVSIALARGLYNFDPKVEALQYVYDLLNEEAKNTLIGKQLGVYLNKTKNVVIGKQLPDFTLPDISSNLVSLADFKNKYVLVDFWYSGCPPCISQFPKLREIYLKNKGRFEIVGVSHDGEKDRLKWLKVLDRISTGWTQLLDTENVVCDKFGIESFPSNFLLDKNGIILAKNISEQEVEKFLFENK